MAPSSMQPLAQPSNVHHGLASLPTEILAHIRICLRGVDERYHDEPDRYEYRPNTSFPLVCRRFRDLELSIPSFWTLLTDKMNSDRINLHVARSGTLGLKVQIFQIGSACICEKWRLLAQSRHRWSFLSVGALTQQVNCFSTLRGLSFPSLRSLKISNIDDVVIPILSTWSIPSVRAVNSSRPEALLALPLTQPLTTLRLDHGSDAADGDGLLDFLESEKASQLRTLDLAMFRLKVQGGLPMRYKELTLPMLQDLTLRCSVDHQVPEHMVFELMRCIVMPNIQFVSLVLTQKTATDDTCINWIGTLKNPSLRTVSVRVLGFLEDSIQRRIVNTFQENVSGVSRVESSEDSFGVLRVKIVFK